jgi:diguanylate cyclase (GGDEF)-like protein
VLCEIAARLQIQVRPSDTVARVGGDEFVILFGDVLDRKTLESIAARLLSVIQEPIEHEGNSFRISGSLGIATFAGDGHTLADLMSAADSAMYGIKKQGKASFAFYAMPQFLQPE